jgi:hypothetical protein
VVSIPRHRDNFPRTTNQTTTLSDCQQECPLVWDEETAQATALSPMQDVREGTVVPKSV